MIRTSLRATAIGFTALLMWSSLAVLAVAVKDVPPFQILSVGMFLGGVAGALSWPFREGAWRAALYQPLPFWLVGIYGIFGYHLCYFLAFRFAPPMEVNLVNYLWPLLTILFSAFLPGEKLRAHHLIGFAVGLAGVVLAVLWDTQAFTLYVLFGYVLAALCALVWSSYTVLSRRFGGVPTDAVSGYCLATAFLALLCHLVFETTHWPQTQAGWMALFFIGLFPTGLAFYAWDVGVKKGNILFLSVISYGTRIASTLFLWLAGYAPLTWGAGVGVVLVTLGAIIAAKELFET